MVRRIVVILAIVAATLLVPAHASATSCTLTTYNPVAINHNVVTAHGSVQCFAPVSGTLTVEIYRYTLVGRSAVSFVGSGRDLQYQVEYVNACYQSVSYFNGSGFNMKTTGYTVCF